MDGPRSLDKYQEAADLGERGKLEQAWKLTGKMLMDDPNDLKALVTGSYLMRRMGGLPQAYHFAKAATIIAPRDSGAWTNLGHCASEMWLVEEAERCYRHGLRVATHPTHKTSLLVNLSALYIDNGRFQEAEKIAREILAKDPDHHNALANLGFCQLAQKQWDGWEGYRRTIGSDWRPKVQYREEPEWDGSPGKTVVLYADQGLGDEISFASMIPDAIDISKKVIIDCDERLTELFRRSFPQAKVYGTKRAKGEAKWDKEDWDIDASLPLGQIGEYFRRSDASFPGTPYLVPCPTRTSMWKSLWKKPAIGIAWSGGVPKTNSRNRQITLEQLLPVFEHDCHFISLQYKDAAKEIAALREQHSVDLVQYDFATLTRDYDDTAALIASLDYVVCIQTAVAHAAGALGVPVTVLIPEATQWRYGTGESIPWYRSLKIVRQRKTGSWSQEIERASTDIGRLSTGAGNLARGRQLRHRIHSLCTDGESDHRANGRHPPP